MSVAKTNEMHGFATRESGLIVRSFGIGGVGHGKPRNGEAEAVANAVGREAVAHGGCARILTREPSARAAPTTPRRKPRHLREGGRGTETGQ